MNTEQQHDVRRNRIGLLCLLFGTEFLLLFLILSWTPTYSFFLSPGTILSVSYVNTGRENKSGTYLLTVKGKPGEEYQVLRKEVGKTTFEKRGFLTGKKRPSLTVTGICFPGKRMFIRSEGFPKKKAGS